MPFIKVSVINKVCLSQKHVMFSTVIFAVLTSIYLVEAADDLNLTMGREFDYLSDDEDPISKRSSSSSNSDRSSDTDEVAMQIEEEAEREATRWRNFTIAVKGNYEKDVGYVTKWKKGSTYYWTPKPYIPTTVIPKHPEPRGTFYDFVARLCHTLIARFDSKKLRYYIPLLRRSIRGLGDGYYMKKVIRKFGNKLKKIAKLNSRKIRKKVYRFLMNWREGRPHWNNFIQALNNMYTTSQYMYLQDYLFSMRKYADKYKKSIDKETRKVFRRWVAGVYNHLNEKDKTIIQFKFKLATLEGFEVKRKNKKRKISRTRTLSNDKSQSS